MATEDQILLKLVIRGMDPAEVQQLAASTQGELNAKIKVYLDQLVGLHKAASAATTADAKKSAQDQISAVEKQIDAVNKVARAQELAANRINNSYRGMMEHLENLTVVATGAWAVIVGSAGRMKELGESIDRVTNIYGSLKGSIKEMQDATDGEVAAIDLITTKNRAFEKGLHLTDQQFGIVAAAADAFADSLGINTKEALDKIIDGLATGKTKMLEHAGVVIDTDKAYREYAKSIGTTADKLSDSGRAAAVAQAALKAMDKKIAESGGVARDFSHEWESVMATLQNQWDAVLLGLGKFILGLERAFTVALPNLLKIGMAQVKDLFSGGGGHYADFARVAYGAELEALNATNMKGVEAAKARQAQGNAPYQIADKDAKSAVKGATPEEAAKFKKDTDETFAILYGDKKRDQRGPDYATAQMYPQLYDMGIANDLHERGGPDDSAIQKLMGNAKPLTEELEALENEVNAKKEAMEKNFKETADKAGGGLFARLLFGPDGPDTLYEHMDHFQQASVDAMGMISDASMKMADALGASLAAAIAGDEAHKKSIKQITHDVLESLAAQALSRAIFETAEGLASLALGPLGGASASAHFAAAAMFGAVGVTAGVAARAFGGAGSGAASGTSTAGAGSFNTPRSSANDNGRAAAPITVNLSVWPGGEAEAGRQVAKALGAYTREAGVSIVDVTTGKAAA